MAETGSVELEVEAGWWVLSIEEACPLRPGEAAVGRRGEPGLWNHLQGKLGVPQGGKLKRQRNCFGVKEMHAHKGMGFHRIG